VKVLLLTTHLDIGGISNYTIWLAKGLKEEGHEVIVASGGGELLSELAEKGIRHFKINIKIKNELSPSLFKTTLNLLGIIKKEEVAIIHAQTRLAQVIAHHISKLSKVPYITTCHGVYKKRLFRRIFPCWGQRVIAISEPVRAHLVNCFKVPKQRIRLIHNGLEVARFCRHYTAEQRRDNRQHYGLNGKSKVIGNVARLVSVKGQEYLLYAAKEILKVRPKTQFLIVGDGRDRQKLIDLTRKLKIADNVFFTGTLREINRVLSVMDIFAFPAFWQEGFGLSILEAMAAGLPVVASNVGGIYTLVKNKRNGLLVPPRDVPSLVNALLRLLDDKSLVTRMGEEGRKRAIEKFSLDKVVKQIMDVYKEVVH
jgi:glycosyltransferase involved in cell wall biosynthesis